MNNTIQALVQLEFRPAMNNIQAQVSLQEQHRPMNNIQLHQ